MELENMKVQHSQEVKKQEESIRELCDRYKGCKQEKEALILRFRQNALQLKQDRRQRRDQ